jgi:uncharacterized repeat protein (TIGR02543 family)
MSEAADAGICPIARRLAAIAAALLVALAALGAVAPTRAWATETIPLDGNGKPTAASGDGWRYDGNELNITGDVTVVGTCTCSVFENPEGTISGGRWSGDVFESGTISGGTFTGEITLYEMGKMTGGTFYGKIKHYQGEMSLGPSLLWGVTNTLTHVTTDNPATAVASDADLYTETLTADTGYALPANVSVTMNGVTATAGKDYTWCTESASTGTLAVPRVTSAAEYDKVGPIVVTAAGVPVSYALAFDANGHGTAPAAQTVAYGAKATTPVSPSAAGYAFGGWYADATCTGTAVDLSTWTMPASDTTLYAKWTEDANVTISYATADAAKGTVSLASESVAPATGTAAGSTATASAGYHFVSWTKDGVEVSTDATFAPAKVGGLNVAATYTANFAGNAYKVAFDKNSTDATGFMADEDMTYDAEKALSANAFSRAGYTFSGWNTAPDGKGTSYAGGASVSNLSSTAGATVTLYAQWAEDANVTISYAATAGGTVSPASESVRPATGSAAGSTATPAAGCHFVDWTDADGAEVSTSATLVPARPAGGAYVAATYTANFAGNAYEVAFDANGGMGTMASQAMAYGASARLAACTLTAPAGRHFAGWAAAEGGAVAYADGASVSDLTTEAGATVTLWAVWAEDANVTISYVTSDAAAGTVSPGSESVAPATGAAKGATATARAGYHFVDWTDASGKEVSTSAALVPAKAGGAYATATYTANFAGNAYEVAFDPNGGTGTMAPQAMAYGTPAALSANALSRANWSFAGWNTEADGSGTAYTDAATVSNLTTADGATVTLYAQWRATAGTSESAPTTASVNGAATTTPATGDGTSPALPVAIAGASVAAIALARRRTAE